MRFRDLKPEKQKEVKIFLGEKERKSEDQEEKEVVYIDHM